MRIVAAFAVASLFSLLYAGLYPILTGSFVLYWYPAWPTSMAGAYVAGGAVLQAWLCTRRGGSAACDVAIQVAVGLGYLLLIAFLPGGLYMS